MPSNPSSSTVVAARPANGGHGGPPLDKYDICRIADYSVVLQDLNIPGKAIELRRIKMPWFHRGKKNKL